MTLVIAHRGASGARPENTIGAFVHARTLGADWIELDVRRSADGHLVVHHDPFLRDGPAIASLARAEIPVEVPALAEALQACAGMGVNVEIKNDPTEPGYDPTDSLARAVAAVVLTELGPARSIISSFDLPTIDQVRKIAPALPTGYLTYGTIDHPAALAGLAERGGHRALHPWERTISAELVSAAHDVGLAVYAWTVDDPQRMAELVALGVDGLITNHPDRAVAMLR